MCGIVGYVGDKAAQPVLLDCLRKLEYRGYDSCGIAVDVDSGAISVCKDAVRVDELSKNAPTFSGGTGIGHTRWATHGRPSQINAHPHLDCTGKIAVVHNGVISNYQELRQRLVEEGHKLRSETDTEVIPHLIEKHYQGNLVSAVEEAIKEIKGSYAIIAMMAGEPRLVVARMDSPLIIGLGDRGNYIASDVPAFLNYTNRIAYVEDGDIAVISPGEVKIRRNGTESKPDEQKVMWSVEEAKKGGYDHFMLKEIHEQPRVIRNTVGEYAQTEGPITDLSTGANGGAPLVLLACGTSYYAALVGRHIFYELAGADVRVELASEFNYYNRVPARTTAIAITQSGETADTLKAMKRMREAGSRIVAVTNVVGSTASRIAGQTIYTRAGPEISVAATKSFTAQLVVLYLMAVGNADVGTKRLTELAAALRHLPTSVQRVLDEEAKIEQYAKYLKDHENAFFVARGLNFPVALEGALKLKEISYIHAEGMASGEVKHGPLALITEKTPVIAIVAGDNTREAMLTSIKEIKARGAPVAVVAEEGDDAVEEVADTVITVPKVDPLFSPVVNTVAVQLLAYYTARERGCPIDFPRNLAKSVTVE